jgi:CspA family cold shock protein
MARELSGTVKWYNPEKAYGFITVDTGEDVFVHRNAIADGRGWLVDGQGVSLVIRQGAKGPEAAEVRVVQDVAEVPARREAAYSRATSGAGGYGYGRDDAYGGYGNGGGYGAPRRQREPYRGPLPDGPVSATVQRIDPNGRFLFARLDREAIDVYVHGSLVNRLGLELREGDRIEIAVEQSERGPRARTLAAA